MGSWLDRMARRAASTPDAATPIPSAPPVPTDDHSRRNFLKKAAVVTGAAWSVPVLQTALAPMASASPGSGVGQVCTGGTSDNGQLCGDGSKCFGGICGNTGAGCAVNAHCVSQLCVSNVCAAPRPPGGTCTVNANCQYGNCNGTTCGGLGASCTSANQPTQCATVGSVQIYCQPGTGSKTCGGVGAPAPGCPGGGTYAGCTSGKCNNGQNTCK